MPSEIVMGGSQGQYCCDPRTIGRHGAGNERIIGRGTNLVQVLPTASGEDQWLEVIGGEEQLTAMLPENYCRVGRSRATGCRKGIETATLVTVNRGRCTRNCIGHPPQMSSASNHRQHHLRRVRVEHRLGHRGRTRSRCRDELCWSDSKGMSSCLRLEPWAGWLGDRTSTGLDRMTFRG